MEQLAIDWVERCEKKQPNTAAFPAYKGMGLALEVSAGLNPNLYKIVNFWFHTAYDYFYDSGSCYGDCDNYKQVGRPNA